MFDLMAKEVIMKEISQVASEIRRSKQALHSQFQTFDISNTGKIDSTEKMLEKALDKGEVKEFFSEESSYLRSMNERSGQALGSEGQWYVDGDKLKFVPEDENALNELREKGLDGIKYDKYAEPDFGPVAKETVQIDNMSFNRYGPGKNFEQADTACAKIWNEKAVDGRTDWTARDVENWRENPNHKYTWHERSDMKTMDLVPSDVHDSCKHYGGCSECKARDGELGGKKFDE